jgi:hypothetical protein
MTTRPTKLLAPWSLHFDRDGTEDVAIICDVEGNGLARSRYFWLPESADPIPPTLAAMRVMVAAPKLLEALDGLLAQTVDMDLKHGIALSEGEQDARARALAAIAEATTVKSSTGDPTNEARARWARNALAVFTAETFSGDDPDTMARGDLECAIGDLICDLLHFTHQQGFDPRAALEQGSSHFKTELLLDD